MMNSIKLMVNIEESSERVSSRSAPKRLHQEEQTILSFTDRGQVGAVAVFAK